MVKNPPVNAGDAGSIPGSGRSPGEGNGNPLQYSCPKNPMDRGVRWATVHEVTNSWTLLSEHAKNYFITKQSNGRVKAVSYVWLRTFLFHLF